MESRTDNPHLEARETSYLVDILPANKPLRFSKNSQLGLLSMVENNGLITNNQFGFRQRHSTIEHTHRIIKRMNEALEKKQYYSAMF
jgi:hypothetical protein